MSTSFGLELPSHRVLKLWNVRYVNSKLYIDDWINVLAGFEKPTIENVTGTTITISFNVVEGADEYVVTAAPRYDSVETVEEVVRDTTTTRLQVSQGETVVALSNKCIYLQVIPIRFLSRI